MAAERVAAQEHDVGREDEGADADSKLGAATGPRKPQRLPHIVAQHHQEEQRDVQEVAVDVLQDERKSALAEITLPELANGAVWWISPERLVVCPAIVIAREPEEAGKRKDQQRRREREKSRPPSGLGTEPRVWRVTEQLRRVEGREVRSVDVIRVLECGPCCVDHE